MNWTLAKEGLTREMILSFLNQPLVDELEEFDKEDEEYELEDGREFEKDEYEETHEFEKDEYEEENGNEFDVDHELEKESVSHKEHETRDDLLQLILIEIQNENIEKVKELSKMLTVEEIDLLYQTMTQKETGQKRPPPSTKEKKASVFMAMKRINY